MIPATSKAHLDMTNPARAGVIAAAAWALTGVALLVLGGSAHESADWCLSARNALPHCGYCYAAIGAFVAAVASFTLNRST